MLLHRGPLSEEDPALELAVAHALVRRAGSGEITQAIRVYRPRRPVAVFGRRDTRLPQFSDATRAAAAAGFTPVVRATGGRAVAYTNNAIVVDHVMHDRAGMHMAEQRFRDFGGRLCRLFLSLGIDARVGAVPGEYCPGAHSVNARGTVKLAGTAQRIIKNAWLFSSLIIVGDEFRVRPVLSEIYGCLDQPFDSESVGSLSGEQPALAADAVERAIIESYGITPSDAEPLHTDTLALARLLSAQHRT